MPIANHGQATAIGVKSHVLYSRLLTSADYWTMLNFNATNEVVDFLSQTEGYEGYLDTLPPDAHRIDLETAIRSSLLSEAVAFLSYLSGAQRKLFIDWLGYYEADHLKSIFRWIRSRRVDRDIMRKKLVSIPGSKLSYDVLLNSRNYSEALEALRDTRYYKVVAEPVRRLIAGETSLFPLEIAIDNLAEIDIFKDLGEMAARDSVKLEPLFGARVDLMNLYHVHRCVWYFNMTLEETLSRMLPIKYKIKTHHLREMFKGADWEERINIFGESFPVYAGVFREALKQSDNELALETAINRSIYLKALSIFQKGSPGFHTAMSYFMLKAQEINDIIRIIEYIRYDYDRKSAAAYLVRPITLGGEQIWQ